MQFGVHCRLWTKFWTTADLDMLDHAKEIGFSALEISLGNLAHIEPAKIRARAEKVGIEVISALALSKEYDLVSGEAATRRRSVEFLKAAVTALRDLGGRLFGGMFYAVPGKFTGTGPTADELSWLVEGVKEVAVFAQTYGVSIAIEPVNRYETYLLNTAAQAQTIIDRVGEPNLGMLLDTYQMNIEERGIAAAIIRHGAALRHLHLNESDRGTLGGANIDWPSVFGALEHIGYRGMGSIEVFGSPSPQVPAITPIWRELFPSPDQMARDGLAFLQRQAASAFSARPKS